MLRPRSTSLPASSDRPTHNPLTVALLASLWIAVLANWPLWRTLSSLPEMASARGAVFIVGFGIAVAALTFLPLALLAWRLTIKPAVALFLLAAAFGAHFIGTYCDVLDRTT